MYQPHKYQKKETEYIFRFIQEHPFATFITKGETLMATHIPVLTEGDASGFRLYAHIADHNEQLSTLQNNEEALLVFSGAHSYVSSSWYNEVDISTWDYSAVHINATINVQSRKELVNSLQKLVERFEKEQDKPIYYKDLPQDIIDEHLPHITGFWLNPTKILAIAKLHQGFSHEDIHSITQHLDQKNDPLARKVSEAIKKEHGTKN